MEPTLKQFLEAYLKWVEDGAPNRKPFDRQLGLCTNAVTYGLDYWEMARHFENETPFNQSKEHYCYDKKRVIHHLNPKRIQWVKDKLKELEDEN